ncbi:MAG TPA: aryl-sulfate sulfotransferase [Flavitalea sp.]|nr:aryl-sulfate sulfotransferase [Flavitalea sp.]
MKFSKFALSRLVLCCLVVIRLSVPVSAQPAATSSVTHSFFIAGPDFTGIIGEDGSEVWNAGQPGARDGFVLSNGNVLVCWADIVKEFDKAGKVIFSFKRTADDNELGTAVRLPSGNTFITESGKTPRIIEVDKRGKIVATTPLQPESDNTHMQTRMARKLDNGNYLVPHLLAFSVKEYTPTGEVVNVFRSDLPALGGREEENWPFTAIRLKNGNTLVTLTHGNKVVEFDKNGNVEWKISNDDFVEKPFSDPCGAQRLSNGNTVIASYGASEGVKLFEVNAAKKLVWTYTNHRVHEFQILTTNGLPLTGNLMK